MMSSPALRRSAAGCLLVLMLGCAESPSISTRVLLRLNANDFTADSAPDVSRDRNPVAVVGGVAREVVASEQRVPILPIQPISESSDDLNVGLRRAFSIPAAAQDLSVDSFELTAMEVAKDQLGRDAMMRELVGADWTRLESGWQLERDPSDPSRGVIEFSEAVAERTALFQFAAFRAAPKRLESRALPVPSGATFELAIGLAHPERADKGDTLSFRASLACEGVPESILLDHSIVVDDPESTTWYDTSVVVPAHRGDCRLRLDSSGAQRAAPVWAIPRLVDRVPAGETFDDRNLILISIDTLRSDHLSGYGYPRETSPAIDRMLIDRGTTFTDVSTTYPMTHVAHMSVFTGLYPAAFGDSQGLLPARVPVRTLTESLRDGGFETAAFTEGGLLSGARGFWYGFDQFTERGGTGHAKRTFDSGIRYLEDHSDRKFFLFLHTYQVHAPYRPSKEFAQFFVSEGGGSSDSGKVTTATHLDGYDREIRETDAAIADFLEALEQLGMDERSYVVLISDHGESLGEHGKMGHGPTPYEEALKVPFIIRGPNVRAGHRVSTAVSLVDVMPTLLEMLGVPELFRGTSQIQGRSLDASLHGGPDPDPRPVFFEWRGPSKPAGVRTANFKFTHSWRKRPDAIYDLATDPQERFPNTGQHPTRESARRILSQYQAEGAKRAEVFVQSEAESNPLILGNDELRVLKALGYLE